MRRLLTLLLCLGTAIGGTLGVPASAADPLPVTYSFVLGTVQAGADPSPSAPGSNDWTCRPSAAHPRPVVLVHGTYGAADTNWMTYSPLLKNYGYCVFALTYGVAPGTAIPGAPLFGGQLPIEQSAAELAAFIDTVLQATGASQVDLVGHSQGTLMPSYYLKFLGGASKVKRYVSLASVWHGTAWIAPLTLLTKVFAVPETSVPVCNACGQMGIGSAFLAKLRAGGVAVPGVEYTNIVTRFDQIVVPYTSGIEPGMRNIVVQDRCGLDLSDHLSIASSPNAAGIVLNTLDPEHPRPVPCRLVLPALGTL